MGLVPSIYRYIITFYWTFFHFPYCPIFTRQILKIYQRKKSTLQKKIDKIDQKTMSELGSELIAPFYTTNGLSSPVHILVAATRQKITQICCPITPLQK